MAPTARSFTRRDTILVTACILLSMAAQGLPAPMRDPLAGALRRTVVAPLVALQRDAELTRRAWVTREERAVARDSVLLRSMTLQAVESENARLRRLLGLGRQLRWGFVPAEVLHGGTAGEAYVVTLSAGARAGVRAFSPVVAPDGLVGMVRTVDPSMSSAIIWPHPDFRVSAMAADGSAFGIVAAHLADEPERFLLEMRGVPFRSTLKRGTVVVSSGLGGVYPRGIPIGTVLGELKTSEVWARTYILRPAVLPADVTTVMVLLPQRTQTGVETVWSSGRALDSAARSIVLAGDSLARAATPPPVASPAVPTDSLRAERPAADGAQPGAGASPHSDVRGVRPDTSAAPGAAVSRTPGERED